MSKFKQFVDVHSHLNSLDTGSLIENFAKREVELGGTHLVSTEHGYLGAAYEVSKTAKKHGLKHIQGLEAYFRPSKCDILKSFGIENIPEYEKYFHLTMHFKDEAAFKKAGELLSKADLTAEKHGSERKPIFDWCDLEELASHNVTVGSSCLAGFVSRHLKNHRYDIAEAYYKKLRSMFAGNFWVEMFPHEATHYHKKGLFIDLLDGRKFKFHKDKKLKVTTYGEITAQDLAKVFSKDKNVKLIGIKNYSTWEEVDEIGFTRVELVDDFVQNDCHPVWCPDGDMQQQANKFVYEMAKKYGDKILISLDKHVATVEDKIVQDVKLINSSGTGWRFHKAYYIKTSEECYDFFNAKLGISEKEFESWIDNSFEFGHNFDNFKLTPKSLIPVDRYPKDTLGHLKMLIEKHGRMDWNNPKMVDRLNSEIELLNKNGTVDLLPYFFTKEEVIDAHAQKRLLTGPGRGSAAGLLTNYLLGITHIDPLEYKLSQDRFLTKDRILSGKMPDIDSDLGDREFLIEWLDKEFKGKYAQIAARSTIKLKAAAKDVFRASYGEVPFEVEQFTEKLPMEPQGVDTRSWLLGYKDTDGNLIEGEYSKNKDIQDFAQKHPVEWEKVMRVLSIGRSHTRHASAYLLTNDDITKDIPLMTVSDVRVTQYDMHGVEAAGGIKYDFLVINSLKDVQEAIRLVQLSQLGKELVNDEYLDGKLVESFKIVPFNGRNYDIYKLPYSNEVYNEICNGDTETVFQLNTDSARKWLRDFNFKNAKGTGKLIDSIEDISAFTALDRPGGLDAYVEGDDGKKYNILQEYARRARGIKNSNSIKFLDQLLPETYGLIVYQEQLQYIFQILAKTDGVTANKFRDLISKKKMLEVIAYKPMFMKGALEQISENDAETIWAQMLSSGNYCFNKSHSVSYSTLSYACAFLKHYYPLQWWAAVLKNADKNEIAQNFWRYCGHLVDSPDINKSKKDFEIVGNRIQAPLSFLLGIGPKAHEELTAGAPYKSLEDFCQRSKDTKEAKTYTDPETGKKVNGRCALNSGHISKLIVSGVMDSLFQPGTDVYQKVFEFERVSALVNGKKKAKAVDKEFVGLSPLKLYQLRKQILMIYSQNLIPKLEGLGNKNIRKVPIKTQTDTIDTYRYLLPYKDTNIDYLFVTSRGYHKINENDLYPLPAKLALIGYIMDHRKWSWDSKDDNGVKKKHAFGLTFECNGDILEFVKWPNWKSGKVDPYILNEDKYSDKDLNGSIAIILLTKNKPGSKFTLDKIEIIEPPLGEK